MSELPYARLRARIAMCFPNLSAFSKAIEMDPRRVRDRLNGRVKVDVDFIEKCCRTLSISPVDAPNYFVFLQ